MSKRHLTPAGQKIQFAFDPPGHILPRQMAAKLRVIQAGMEPEEVFIGNTALIGRTRDNTVCLSHCPLTSRQHAVIRSHNAYEYQVIDLGSRNGTFVNGKRVVMPVTLASGDSIQVGSAVLVFEQELETDAGEFGAVTMQGAEAAPSQTSQPVSILVCDIRGFTSMSEKLSEADVARVLGKWFREASKIIHSAGGTVDKFIGDAILAYWSRQMEHTTVTGEETVDTLARTAYGTRGPTCSDAALEAARRLVALAGGIVWPQAGTPFSVGVALHFGNAIFSNIGIMAERDATIIGDAVNTAFRLETVMKRVGIDVVVSDDFRLDLRDPSGFRDLGEHQLKGKSASLRVYAPPWAH